jgi:hypothetical protein
MPAAATIIATAAPPRAGSDEAERGDREDHAGQPHRVHAVEQRRWPAARRPVTAG